MADDVLLDNGNSPQFTVATDDDGTAHHQLVKNEWGGDGEFFPVDTDTPLPVGNYPQSVSGSITGSAQTITLPCTGLQLVTIAVQGTYAGVNLAFETSYDGGTTWHAIQAQRGDTGTVATTTGVITANSSWNYDVAINGATHFRVRSTAYTSGTCAVYLIGTPVGTDSIVSVANSLTIGSTVTVSTRQAGGRIAVTPVITTTPYSVNDQVGGVMTFASAASANSQPGFINGITVTDRSKQHAELELWMFGVSPTVASSDNAAFDMTDANLEAAQFIGVWNIKSSAWLDTASNSVVQATPADNNPSHLFIANSSNQIFGILVSRGTPTYAVGDLVVALFVERH